jgi:DNA-binding response OmpR family regulator
MSNIIDLSDKKILVVEDDDMNYIYLTQIFKITKGDITRAKTGKQALDYAHENKYDIILMDIQLPDISGNDVVKNIREFDTNTPIIAQTASRTPDETEESIEAGCSSVLIKPFTIDDLSEAVSIYLS